jgi:signal transduction histidine kinase
VAEEQLQMAQDLHDGVGHGLAVIAMQAGVALRLLDRVHDHASVHDHGEVWGEVWRSLQLIREASTESLDALRAELARMSGEPRGGPRARPPDRTPRRGLDAIPGLLERVRSGGTHVELICRPDVLIPTGGGEGPGAQTAVAPATAAAAYAIVQESLTNMLRHAAATRATVTLRLNGSTLVVTVTDDGTGSVGTGPAGTGPGAEEVDGQGIAGMRARAERLGGTLQAGPDDGGGWRVRAVLPNPVPAPARELTVELPAGPGEVEADDQ